MSILGSMGIGDEKVKHIYIPLWTMKSLVQKIEKYWGRDCIAHDNMVSFRPYTIHTASPQGGYYYYDIKIDQTKYPTTYPEKPTDSCDFDKWFKFDCERCLRGESKEDWCKRQPIPLTALNNMFRSFLYECQSVEVINKYITGKTLYESENRYITFSWDFLYLQFLIDIKNINKIGFSVSSIECIPVLNEFLNPYGIDLELSEDIL